MSVLEWLAQHLEHVALEFRELVEEEHAAVRERHLPRLRMRTAAQETDVGDRVVRSAEGALDD